MRNACVGAAALLVLAVTAAGQDAKPPVGKNPPPPAPAPTGPAPTGPAPTGPAPTGPAAKKERKSSPEAEAAIARYVDLVHFPRSDYAALEMKSHCDFPPMGGEVGCRFVVKDGAIALSITLPEAFVQQAGPGQIQQSEKAAGVFIERFFKPFLVPVDRMSKQFDLAARTAKDPAGKETTFVDLVQFAEGAPWQKATLTFDADGLLTKVVGTPNVDMNDPLDAANAGAEIESSFTYKKRGERYTIESGSVVSPMGETKVDLKYWEVEGVSPLPKELDVVSPLIGELAIHVHDYVVNGKSLPATARKDEPKPAPPGPAKPSPTTPDPAKPADPKSGGK